MGSLASRPSVPKPQPQVIYVPQPARAPAPAPAPSTPTPGTDNAGPTKEQADSEARRQSLLGRERSRFGTILTSFRGFLGTTDNAQIHKTLLGE